MFNKRGLSGGWKATIIFGSIFLFFVVAWYLVNSSFWAEWTENLSIDTTVEKFDTFFGKSFSWMNYVFGGIPAWLSNQVGVNSAIVITLFTWLLLFVTFGDIFSSFSTFSKPVSWIVGFSIAVIAANLKAIVVMLGFFIGIFAFFGGLAVIAGLFASLVAFFAVNWGIGSLGPWILRRRVLIEAEKSAIKSEAGGHEIAGAIRGIKEVGKALKEK